MAASPLPVLPPPGAALPPALRVHFTNPDEFVAELRRRPPDVEPLVRLSYRWTADPDGLPLRHLAVVAGYARCTGRGLLVLADLVHDAGQVWPGLDHAAAARTRKRAHRAHATIAEAARELGLEVCAGAYELGAGAGAPCA